MCEAALRFDLEHVRRWGADQREPQATIDISF